MGWFTRNDEYRALRILVNYWGKKIMAGQAELDAKLDELRAAVDKEMQQLKDAVAASAPDLAPQVAKVQAAIDALNSDDPPAS